MFELDKIAAQAKIIPVITIHNIAHALPLAEALITGGLDVLEITLRTPVGLDAIKEISDAFPDCKVGAGTVIDQQQFEQAKTAGACFAVSPVTTLNLVEAAEQAELAFLPGISTLCELAAARELGYHFLKFFPANLSGDVAMLKTFDTLFPDVCFCPTGGIDGNNLTEYLTLDNVLCVGGSWIAPTELINKQDWTTINKKAKDLLKKG